MKIREISVIAFAFICVGFSLGINLHPVIFSRNEAETRNLSIEIWRNGYLNGTVNALDNYGKGRKPYMAQKTVDSLKIIKIIDQ